MEKDNIKEAEEAIAVLNGIIPTFRDLLNFQGLSLTYSVGTKVFYFKDRKIDWSYHYDVKTPVRTLVVDNSLVISSFVQGIVIGTEQCIKSNYSSKDHETLHVLYLTGHLDIINHPNFNDKHTEDNLYLRREEAVKACTKELKKARNQYIREEKVKKQNHKEQLERELNELKNK